MRRYQHALKYLPALFLIPTLFIPLPLSHHPAREIAGYFQTRALLIEPIESFAYLTPLESYSSFHLHSILSTPLLAVGVFESGRYVSFAASIATITTLSLLARGLFDNRIALLTPAVLWMHPLYQRFATVWWPDSLSLALTCGAVYCAYRYANVSGRQYYAGSIFLLALGVTNHMWEASIALPIVALLWFHDHRTEAVGAAVATLASVAAVEAVKSMTTTGGSLFKTYGIINNWDVLLNPGWYLRLNKLTPELFQIAISATLPLALLALGWSAITFWRQRSESSLLIGSWILSGLVIILLLPRGFKYHYYYIWGLLIPLSLFGTIALQEAINFASGHGVEIQPAHLVAVLLISASAYGLVFESLGSTSAYPASNNNELQVAGQDVREMSIESSNRIAFIGDWNSRNSIKYTQTPNLTRVLIYSGATVRERDLRPNDRYGPQVVENKSNATDCAVMLTKSNDTISVEAC